MTLIARMQVGTAPVYVGDLLLSRSGSTERPVAIPASRDINAKLPSGTERSVVGLKQKLNILGNDLIIAWAGNLLQARSLMKDIRGAVTAGANWHEVNALIEATPIEDRDDLSLIGSIVRPATEGANGLHIQHFAYSLFKRTVGDVEITVAGSGANDFLALAPQAIAAIPSGLAAGENNLRPFKLALAMSAAMIGHESSTGQNILNWWGGGIEIAGLSKGRFEKLSNVLHTVWKARPTNKNTYEISLVPKFTKYDYVDEALVAQTFEFSFVAVAQGIRATTVEHSYGICTPLLRSASEYNVEAFKRSDFGHQTLCCYLMFDPPLDDPSLVVVYHSDSGDTPLKLVTSAANKIELGFRADLVQALEAQVSRAKNCPAIFTRIGS